MGGFRKKLNIARPVFSTRISMTALASILLWLEKEQYNFEKKHNLTTQPLRIRSTSELIREAVETFALSIIRKYPEMKVSSTEDAIRVFESRWIKVPVGQMTSDSLHQVFMAEMLEEVRETALEVLEPKAEPQKYDKDEYRRQLEEFEKREQMKREALKNASRSIVKETKDDNKQ